MIELCELKGIGPKSIKLLNKLGIESIDDLIRFYPFRYDEIKRSNIDELEDGDKIIIDGLIESNASVYYFNRKLDKTSFKLNTCTHLFNITIFNRGFLKNQLKVGTAITVIGKLEKRKSSIVVSDISFNRIEKEKIEPVYHTTYGLTNNNIIKLIDRALEHNIILENYIPTSLIKKYNFIDKMECIKEVHHPTSMKYLNKVRNQLKYEELFLFMAKMNYLKNNKTNQIGLDRDVAYDKVEDMIRNLPFKLTDDQLKSVNRIYDDLTSKNRMNRLIQGDVGSGKTIVAIIAMYINFLSGYQSALMAPTEILAHQHFNNITELLSRYNIKIALLTGKLKTKEKKAIYSELEDGNIDIIIGTHALFTDDVKYNNLGLVITDEQHRFGVNQRSSLKNKGIKPDILYMSATPIPRTYALTLYGDMDISSIRTSPNGRKKIITTLKKENEIKDVLNSMLKELKAGHQIYVIAPLIEESDKIDLKNVNDLYEKMNKAFGKLFNVGILHGKMTNDEKEDVMNKFSNNEIQILISTTVVEVGVDVRNATMMVIFDSFRFGLSALHQLRGRVGRNDLQSYCILISNFETERLKILTETNDGFKISEEDFLLRGSGDLFGSKQSGDMVMNIADLKRDYNILLRAKEDSEEFLSGTFDNLKDQRIINYIEHFTNLD